MTTNIDSREKLEADIWSGCEHLTMVGMGEKLVNVPYGKLLEWLDRQAAITERESCGAAIRLFVGDPYNRYMTGEEITGELDKLALKLKVAESINRGLRDAIKVLEAFSSVLTKTTKCQPMDDLMAECDENEKIIARLQRENMQLARDLEESEKLREAMREKLSQAVGLAADITRLQDLSATDSEGGMRA